MRLKEFTNAEEQLALLRIIIDNTWSAVEQQAREQAAQQAQAAAKRSDVKPKRKPVGATANPLPTPKRNAAKPNTAKPNTAKPASKPSAAASTQYSQPIATIKPKPPVSVGTAAATQVPTAQPGSAV